MTVIYDGAVLYDVNLISIMVKPSPDERAINS